MGPTVLVVSELMFCLLEKKSEKKTAHFFFVKAFSVYQFHIRGTSTNDKHLMLCVSSFFSEDCSEERLTIYSDKNEYHIKNLIACESICE